MDATYINSNQFSVNGNQTSLFVEGRVVQCDCGVDGVKYGYVQSASYSAPNTTVILDSSHSEGLTSNLQYVFVGSIKTGNHGNVPSVIHSNKVKELFAGEGITFVNDLFAPNLLIGVAEANPSAVNSSSFTVVHDKTYKLIGYVELSDNTADLAIRFNNENSGYLIAYHESKDSGSSSVHNSNYDESSTYYRIIGGNESAKIFFEVDIRILDWTNDIVFTKSEAFGYYDNTNFGREDNSGYKEVTGDISSLSVFPTSGNFSGNIKLYEVR